MLQKLANGDNDALIIAQNINFADYIQSTMKNEDETKYLKQYFTLLNNNSNQITSQDYTPTENQRTYTKEESFEDETGNVVLTTQKLDIENLLKDFNDTFKGTNQNAPLTKQEARWILEQAGVDINHLIASFRTMSGKNQEQYLEALKALIG